MSTTGGREHTGPTASARGGSGAIAPAAPGRGFVPYVSAQDAPPELTLRAVLLGALLSLALNYRYLPIYEK